MKYKDMETKVTELAGVRQELKEAQNKERQATGLYSRAREANDALRDKLAAAEGREKGLADELKRVKEERATLERLMLAVIDAACAACGGECAACDVSSVLALRGTALVEALKVRYAEATSETYEPVPRGG